MASSSLSSLSSFLSKRRALSSVANMTWDLMQARNIPPTLSSVEAYYKGLKEREIPEDDPRLMLVTRTYDTLRRYFASFPYRFLQRNLTVHHVAFSALADIKDVNAMEALLEMLRKDGKDTDTYCVLQIMRCYLLHSKDFKNGLKWFEDYMASDKTPAMELYTTLIEGAMTDYTEEGMKIAQETLVKMNDRNFFLDAKTGSNLLLKAAGEKTGGYTVANMTWDLMQARNIPPTLSSVEAYYKGLKEREIPEDDPRLMLVTRMTAAGVGLNQRRSPISKKMTMPAISAAVVLLGRPPGTGKTMVAWEIARAKKSNKGLWNRSFSSEASNYSDLARLEVKLKMIQRIIQEAQDDLEILKERRGGQKKEKEGSDIIVKDIDDVIRQQGLSLLARYIKKYLVLYIGKDLLLKIYNSAGKFFALIKMEPHIPIKEIDVASTFMASVIASVVVNLGVREDFFQWVSQLEWEWMVIAMVKQDMLIMDDWLLDGWGVIPLLHL